MIRINLLPVRESHRQAVIRQQGMLIGLAAAVGLVVAVGLHLSIEARISTARSRIQAAEAEFAKLKGTLEKIEVYKKRKEEIQRKLAVITELERARSGPVRILDEIATRIPDRLWLTNLSLKSGLLQLTGYGLDNEIIAAFMTSLGESEFLSNVELVETHLESKKGLRLSSFKIRSRDTRGMQLAAANAANSGR